MASVPDHHSTGVPARACNAAGCGPWSALANTSVTRIPTAAPSLSAPASDLTGTFTIGWSAVAHASSYRLDERLNGGDWVAAFDDNATEAARTERTTGAWGYRVQACNAAGCGEWSPVVEVVVTRLPAVPVMGGAHNHRMFWGPMERTACTVSWDRVDHTDHYEMGPGPVTYYSGPQTTYSGVSPYFADLYMVRACNAAGCSSQNRDVHRQRIFA